MNRVYKIVWSKAKNAYVVTSELAKNHTKNASGKMVKTALTACGDPSRSFWGRLIAKGESSKGQKMRFAVESANCQAKSNKNEE